jgi:hypothetical protein
MFTAVQVLGGFSCSKHQLWTKFISYLLMQEHGKTDILSTAFEALVQILQI